MIHSVFTRRLLCAGLLSWFMAGSLPAREWRNSLNPFVNRYCADCHANGASEGGLDLQQLDAGLHDPATFAKWERIFDRVEQGEMPPKDVDQPTAPERSGFTKSLSALLIAAHAKTKGTALRRLNRREYENTLNDLFGTRLDLESLLPEDGRSHEFDNVGESLGVSLVHLERYLEAATKVLDASIARTTEQPKPERIEASYLGSREGDSFIGKVWRQLDDGAVVRFSSGGYPTGMMRDANVSQSGRYRVTVSGYAYQSERPITFSVGSMSFAPGSDKPIYGFYSFRPGEAQTVELEAWIDARYMLIIEPYDISDPERYRREKIDGYKGPGLAILKVTLEGPVVDEFPSRGHQLIFDGLTRREIMPRNPADRQRRNYVPRFEVVSSQETQDVTRSLQRVAESAFRRPVTAEDVEPYGELFAGERAGGATVEEALRTAVSAILCSPRFLYLQESPGQLDDYALAARLSYFLTRTTPDAELLKLAAAGKLSEPETLRQQTERLLNDPRSERFLVDFSDAWLDLRNIDFTIPDRSLYTEYDDYLRYSMPLETRAFLRELIESNLPVQNLVQSDFAMLNSRLAALYELPPVTGSEIRKMTLPRDSVRGGLLTQASILKVTANGTNTSPVVRGAWVLERILGETPPPPPPGIPGVEPDIRGASTLRELLDKHRNVVTCNSCHRKIDPPGFALEAFNPIGGYQEFYRSLGTGERVNLIVDGQNVRYRKGPPVDDSGMLPDGRQFEGFMEFRDYLAADSGRLARTLSEKLLTFATGRELGFSDRAALDQLVKASAAQGHGVRDLIHRLVQSDIFRQK